MFLSYLIFLGLLVSSLLDLLVVWPGSVGWRLLAASVALAIVATNLSLRDLAHLRRTASLPLLGLALSAGWVVVQVAPLPFLAHPVWDSARAALTLPIGGHISVDLPSTRACLTLLVLAMAVVLLGATLTIDRDRAETCLAIILIVSCIAAVVSLSGLDRFVSGEPARLAQTATSDLAAYGSILAVANGMLVFERYETRHARQKRALLRLYSLELGCLLAFALFAALLVSRHDVSMIFVAAGGVLSFGFIVAVRRLGLGILGGSAVAIALLAGCLLVINVAGERSDSPFLAFSSGPLSLIDMTHRMIQDSPMVGTGAGTFQALAGQYRGVEDSPVIESPSFVATLVIEMGRPFVWIVSLFVFLTVLLLLRGAFTRGRDSVYSTMGFASVVVVALQAFVNNGLAGVPPMLTSCGMLGLALAQSLRRQGR